MGKITRLPVRRRLHIASQATPFQRLHGILEDAEALPSSFTADDLEKVIQRLTGLRDVMVKQGGERAV